MQLGLVGLGRMGANMRERLRAGGIEVLGFARHAQTRDDKGFVPAPVISAALFARFASGQSRQGEAVATKAGTTKAGAMRAVAALRQQFGGQASPESFRAENHH